MPRRRNSKLSRAIRAAAHEEIRVRRREANIQQQRVGERDEPIIAPARVAERIRLAEQLVRVIQIQRQIIVEEFIPPPDQIAHAQQGEIIAAREIPIQQEPIDDILQLVEDEPAH